MKEEKEYPAKVYITVALEILKQDLFQHVIADKDPWVALANGLMLKDQLEQFENQFALIQRVRESTNWNKKYLGI